MRTRPTFVFGFVVTLLLLLSPGLRAEVRETLLHANTLAEAQKPVRRTNMTSWPSLGRQTAIRLSERQGSWDGMPMSYAVFEGHNLALELRFSDLEYWSRVKPTRGRYSLEFAFQWNPAVVLGVSAFPRTRPFSDLSDETWQSVSAYLATLPDCLIHADDDSWKNGQMLRILGGRTRVINYTTTDTATDAPYRFVQVWVELEGSILVLSLEGPEAGVTQAITAFDSVSRSFSFRE